jgi:RimJ/RimL family protein N-acetyltransferase
VVGVPFDAAYAEGRFEHHQAHWEQHGFGLWLLQEPRGEVAGWVGPAHPTYVPELGEEVEIGWTLRRPFWGRGLATEAAALALETAFEHLAIEEVISLINAANARSSSVATRLGMSRVRDVSRPDTAEVLQVYRRGR